MYFQIEYSVRDLLLKENEHWELNFGPPHNVTVSLRRYTREEIQRGHSERHAHCTASCEIRPSPKIREMFESLAENKLPPGSDEDPNRHFIGEPLFGSDGSFNKGFVLNLFLLPKAFQSFAENVYRELSRHASQTVKVVRWRAALPGSARPLAVLASKWSFDRKDWRPIPHSGMACFDLWSNHPVPSNVWIEVEKLAQVAEEPLGHELFREAWVQMHTSQRSAIVMAMTAAEIAVKQCIITLVPATEWLIQNIPSPPLETMLRDYLPKLPFRCAPPNKVPQLSKTYMDTIRKGVQIRNRIAHMVVKPPHLDSIEEVLLAVHDLLYILDYYCGHEWALEHLSKATKRELKLE